MKEKKAKGEIETRSTDETREIEIDTSNKNNKMMMKKKRGNNTNNNNNNSPLLLLLFLLIIGILIISKESNYLKQYSYSEMSILEQKNEYTIMAKDDKTDNNNNNNDENNQNNDYDNDDDDDDVVDDNEYVIDYNNVATTTPGTVAATGTATGTGTATEKTNKKQRNQHQHRDVRVSPRNMDIKYYEMWNHSTSTINVPEKYKYPFYDGIPSSLEILDSVLHGDENEKEYMNVDKYITSLSDSNSDSAAGNKQTTTKMNLLPNCLKPNIKKTRQIANEILNGKRSRLSLPVLNVGYPKVGSSTLHNYFNCIGISSNHGQNGLQMMEQISKNHSSNKSLFNNDYYTTKDNNTRAIIMAYMQMDYNFGIGSYPQIQLLDELHEEFGSHSTLIINFRPIHDFIRSISNWKSLSYRIGLMDIPGLILTEKQHTNRIQNRETFYGENKNQRVKNAAAILLLNEKLTSNTTLDTTMMTRSDKRMYDRVEKLLQKDKVSVATTLRKASKTIAKAKAEAESKASNNTTYTDTDTRKRKRRKLKDQEQEQKVKRKPPTNLTDQQIARWWCGHIKHIREYVKLYTNHTLIELDLYNTKETSNVLYDIFQSTISSSNSSSSTASTISTTESSQNKNENEMQNNYITYIDVNNANGIKNLQISKNESCWGQSNVNKRLVEVGTKR